MGIAHSTHIPVLLKVLRITSGPVLELGIGHYSTLILHYLCMDMNRILMSYDNNMKYINGFISFSSDMHKIIYAEDWDEVDILKPWSVAFIDHHPALRRGIDAGRLANYAEYVICHDSEPAGARIYGYNEIYPLFKYHWEYTKLKPYTKVLSNFHTLSELGG